MGMCWWIRIRGTVIPAIWWQVVIYTLFAASVVAIEFYVPGLYEDFPTTLISIIGLVTGLLLSFRTNSAYNRYWEGRELWSKMTQEIRKITRAIWTGVRESQTKDLVEKRSALNLCIAFIYAVKHYVREEYGYDYPDLQGLLDHLPKYFTPSSTESLTKQIKKSPDLKAYDKPPPSNIPIEISYYLVSYIQYVDKKGLVDDWALSTMHSSLANLVDSLAGFERILRTPMPLAYNIHLHTCVWLYLLSIPFQTISMGWYSIAVCSFASIFFLGIMAIGHEIENPFGYDDNDLPLEDYCNVIRLGVQRTTVKPAPVANDWLYSEDNKPFGPMCSYTATQLSQMSIQELHDILKSTCPQDIGESLRRKGRGFLDSATASLGLKKPKGYQSL